MSWNQFVLTLLLFLFSFIPFSAQSATTIKHSNESAPLAERWKWGQQQHQQFTKNGVWIAYSIEQQMPENEIIGSFYSSRREFPTIYELLTGNKRPFQSKIRTHDDVQIIAKEQLMRLEGKESGAVRTISREIAILFGYTGTNMDRLEVSLLDLQFDFRGRDLIWLGTTSHEQSIGLLRSLYEKETRAKLGEDLLEGIGIHRSPSLVVPILQQVLNESADDLRAKAAFWLGTQNHPSALKVLAEKLKSEKSEDVIEDGLAGMSEMTLPEADQQMKEWTREGYSAKLRESAIFWLGQKEAPGTLALLEKIAMQASNPEIVEKAIFSMSEMHKTPGVTETLIRIARTQPNREGRKQAIFWLSQNYSEKIEKTIKEFATKDPDREVQKHAIFALSELEDGTGIPELIQIAKTHKDPMIRKEAIFWLGEADDSRAHEALLQLIEEN